LSNDCWGNAARRQPRPSVAARPSVTVPWCRWCPAVPLGASGCSPLPPRPPQRQSPAPRHCWQLLPPSRSPALSIHLATSSRHRGSLRGRGVSSGGQGLRVTAALRGAFWRVCVPSACCSMVCSEKLLYLMSSKANGDSYVP